MTKKQNNTSIQQIDIRLISESNMNPRKNFALSELKELAESIKNQGLLQPITIRPINDDDLESGYQIVCGARRFKATLLTGLKSIPAIVRNMSDEEAFDAMITENLQRKDVEPIDEAIAFKALVDKGVSYEELSARFGKSHQFIRQRVKLSDLIAEFLEMLANKSLQVNHAQELCKLEADEQKEIYTQYYGEDASEYYNWRTITSKELKERLANRFNDLDKQNFDKSECQSCQYRCGSNVLFEEFEANTCINSLCFQDKIATHEASQVVEKINEGVGIILTPKNQQDNNLVILKLKEQGYDISALEDYDWEWPTKEDKNVEKHRRQLEELESGELKNVLIVGYWPNDAYTHVYARFKTSSDTPKSEDDQVYILQSKDKRNKEIQGEKTIADLREMISKSDYESSKDSVSEVEQIALYASILMHCDYQFRRDLLNHDGDNILSAISDLSEEDKNMMIRHFIKDMIDDSAVTYSKERQAILKVVSTEKYPDKTKEIELLHEGTYLKRQESIEKQIKALEK